MEKAEREGSQLCCLALDWKMAFDRLHQNQVSHSVENYQILEALSAAAIRLYSNPTFWTEMDKKISGNKKHKRGIRQGCTLSHNIFNIAMSSLIETVQRTERGSERRQHPEHIADGTHLRRRRNVDINKSKIAGKSPPRHREIRTTLRTPRSTNASA